LKRERRGGPLRLLRRQTWRKGCSELLLVSLR
jgi:hypothetical protein